MIGQSIHSSRLFPADKLRETRALGLDQVERFTAMLEPLAEINWLRCDLRPDLRCTNCVGRIPIKSRQRPLTGF